LFKLKSKKKPRKEHNQICLATSKSFFIAG